MGSAAANSAGGGQICKQPERKCFFKGKTGVEGGGGKHAQCAALYSQICVHSSAVLTPIFRSLLHSHKHAPYLESEVSGAGGGQGAGKEPSWREKERT